MKWYSHRGKGAWRPNFVVQLRDRKGEDRSVPCIYSDIALELAQMSRTKGFWRVKYKEPK